MKRIAVAVAAFVLPLLLAEATIRVVERLRQGEWTATEAVGRYDRSQEVLQLYRRHPYTNTAPRPGASVALHGRSVHISRAGYRGPERSIRRPSADRTLRIVCSGGSTTFDLLARSNDTTWPALLERGLRQRGVEAEVWNAGFPSWTSLENLIALAMRDLELEPDIVILYQGINDLQPAGAVPVDPTYERGHAELSVAALGFDLEPPGLLDRSLLLETLRGFAGLEEERRVIPTEHLNALFPRRHRELPEEARRVFERNIVSFIALARAHGTIPVLLAQPMRLRAGGLSEGDARYLESWTPGFDAASSIRGLTELNLAARRVAALEGALWIDAAEGPDWLDSDFTDPMHYTTAGSAKLAEFVAERLVTELQLDSDEPGDGS